MGGAQASGFHVRHKECDGMSVSEVSLRLRPLSPWHVGSAGHVLGPLDLLADGDDLLRVELDAFVRRLGLAERALFESCLRAADGLRQGHLFMAERLPLCRAGAVSVGRLSPAVSSVLHSLNVGRQRVFRLAHAALQSGEVICLEGGHVRSALLSGMRPSASKSTDTPTPWAGHSFGPLKIVEGSLSKQIALAGRLAPSSSRPLVVTSREDWLQIHCPVSDVVLTTDLLPSRRVRNGLSLEESWQKQCEIGQLAARDLAVQVSALSKMADRSPHSEIARFIQRSHVALQAVEDRKMTLVRIGMGGGHSARRSKDLKHMKAGTVPAAVLARSWSKAAATSADAVPLGWMLLEAVWR